jgi:CheY-like chemotaxis protein
VKNPTSGDFGRIVSQLQEAQNVSKTCVFNPCNLVKVIVADDDSISCGVLRSMIEHSGGYQVFACSNGIEAGKCYETRSEDISVVILDVEMPERNGVETATWIREYEKKYRKRNVPIVGLTGHENEEVKNDCLSAGMNEVLSKPISMKDILLTLKRLTKKT